MGWGSLAFGYEVIAGWGLAFEQMGIGFGVTFVFHFRILEGVRLGGMDCGHCI